MRLRISDKRVLALVKAFLKAGVIDLDPVTREDSLTGTPPRGYSHTAAGQYRSEACSMSTLTAPWAVHGATSNRKTRRRNGLGHLADGPLRRGLRRAGVRRPDQVEAVREEVSRSADTWWDFACPVAKTQVVHMSDGFDFLGFHIKWMRKRAEWKKRLRLHLHRGQASPRFQGEDPGSDPQVVPGRVPGNADPDQPRFSVAGRTTSNTRWPSTPSAEKLRAFVWWRVVHWVMRRQRMPWRGVQRWLRGPTGWRPIALDGIELFNIASTRVSRYRLRGNTIPSPWPLQDLPTRRHDLVESPVR